MDSVRSKDGGVGNRIVSMKCSFPLLCPALPPACCQTTASHLSIKKKLSTPPPLRGQCIELGTFPPVQDPAGSFGQFYVRMYHPQESLVILIAQAQPGVVGPTRLRERVSSVPRREAAS